MDILGSWLISGTHLTVSIQIDYTNWPQPVKGYPIYKRLWDVNYESIGDGKEGYYSYN